MSDTFVELGEIQVLRVRANMNSGGPAAAMQSLEAKLPSLRGRKFYGMFRVLPDGEEYYACVAQIPTDDPDRMQLDTGVIPGGWYARRRYPDWEKDLAGMGRNFEEMMHLYSVDPAGFELEYYRSQAEMFLFVPLRGPPPGVRGSATA